MTDKNEVNSIDTDTATPLCVDLDGTLVQTDLLVESVLVLIKRNVLYLFLLPFWLIKGKARLKQQIADRVELDVSLLPYNSEFLDYLREQNNQGRELVLATASNIKFAEQVALYLGIFPVVLGSDAEINLSGKTKQRRLLDAYGERGFDYAGNSRADLQIWSSSRKAILVHPEYGVRGKAQGRFEIIRIFNNPDTPLTHYLSAIRLHQWLKNLLVFIPVGMAHQFMVPHLLLQAGIAFLAFGLCASSVYILNDLLDLPADRKHPDKRYRPFAAGKLPIKQGLVLIPCLLIASFAIALLLPVQFLLTLTAYYLLTLAYSLFIKQVAIADVLLLAGLYTMRLIAGAAAVSVTPSYWLLAFSMFLFFSLALVKRYSELWSMKSNGAGESLSTRGYRPGDLEGLAQSGISSGFLAVLVLAMYINSEEVNTLYSLPAAIWLLCPLLLYWINRVWLLARRGMINEDPVVFTMHDFPSHLVALAAILVLWVAT